MKNYFKVWRRNENSGAVLALTLAFALAAAWIKPAQAQTSADLRLISQGDSPSQSLRYSWAVGQKESMQVRSAWSDGIKPGKLTLLTRFELEVLTLSPAGEYDVAVKLVEVAVTDAGAVHASQAGLQGRLGHSETIKVNALGQVLENGWARAANAETQIALQPFRQAVAQSAQAFSFGLPQQAIGNQALWESRVVLNQGNAVSALQASTQAQVRSMGAPLVGLSLQRRTRLLFDGSVGHLDQLGQLTDFQEGIVQLDLRRMVPPLYRLGADFEIKS